MFRVQVCTVYSVQKTEMIYVQNSYIASKITRAIYANDVSMVAIVDWNMIPFDEI